MEDYFEQQVALLEIYQNLCLGISAVFPENN